jgi:hypothetical protein
LQGRNRSLNQPFIRLPEPHDDAYPENPYENGQYTYDDAEGDVVVPEACWAQHPDDLERHHYNPTKQWGDRKVIWITNGSLVPASNFPILPGSAGTGTNIGNSSPNAATTYASTNRSTLTGQMIDLKLEVPSVVLVYLSAVDLTGTLTATTAKLFVQWTLNFGCGRANISKQFQQLVGPQNGSVVTDLNIQQAIQALRVSAQVFDTISGGAAPIYAVECTCMVAPFTSYADNVRP